MEIAALGCWGPGRGPIRRVTGTKLTQGVADMIQLASEPPKDVAARSTGPRELSADPGHLYLPRFEQVKLSSIRDRAARSRRDLRRVLGQHASRVTGRGRLPCRAPARDFLFGHVQLKQALVSVDGDRVALHDERDQSADGGFRS